MAFSKIINYTFGKLGIWELKEASEKMAGIYSFSETEKREFDQINNETRKKEYLAVRLLLEKMLQTKTEITYNASRKPRLKNGAYFVSISHSSELAVVLLSEKNTGVDVENLQRKTEQIAYRYLSEQELNDTKKSVNPQLSRILLWSAKEAVFKYSALTEIEFKSHITVFPFQPKPGGGKFRGELRKGNHVCVFTFSYFFYENNVVVYCVEEDKILK